MNNARFKVIFAPEAAIEYEKLDNSVISIVDKAIEVAYYNSYRGCLYMKTMSVSQAKTYFLEIARRAEEQESIIVEKKGEPVLVIIPYQEYLNLERMKHFLAVKDLSNILKDSGITASELHRESRRELEHGRN